MNLDNRITAKRIKKALSPKIVAMVLVIVLIAGAIFYVTVKNRNSKELLIWYVTTEAENCFSDEDLRLINEYGVKSGLDKVVLSKRHPNDSYFEVTMSTTAFYNCDAFIMSAEMVQKYAESGMFMTLDYNGENELLYLGDNAVGILIFENYYLLINEKTDVDLQIIYDIYDILNKK